MEVNTNKVVIKILQGSVVTQIVLDGVGRPKTINYNYSKL